MTFTTTSYLEIKRKMAESQMDLVFIDFYDDRMEVTLEKSDPQTCNWGLIDWVNEKASIEAKNQ